MVGSGVRPQSCNHYLPLCNRLSKSLAAFQKGLLPACGRVVEECHREFACFPHSRYICIHITHIILKIIIQWLTVKQLSPPMDLANIPLLPPPLGVMPNFVNPENRASILIIISTIFLALLLPFVVLRLYTRIWITRTFDLDDGKHAFLT